MFKCLLWFAISMFLVSEARCQNDTTFFYYKYTITQPQLVSTLDSADFIRIFYPPDSSSNLYNIKEFYKNGKIKFVGKFDLEATKRYQSNVLLFSGDCISFYPDGEKQNISHYTDGKKDGLEYFFRPNGHIFYTRKWINQGIGLKDIKLYWDCYDNNDNMICKDGNGKWMLYDADFRNILLLGQVKNGYMDGVWQGATMQSDSIKYICNYKRGAFISAFGYDKAHKAYPFTSDRQSAKYNRNGSLIDFLVDLNKYLKLPKDSTGKEDNIDTVHIAFVIDKDGHLTQFEALGDASPQLKDALNVAVTKCSTWIPNKYFGIPCDSKIIIPLKIQVDEERYITVKSIAVKGQIMDFLKPELDFAQPYWLNIN